MSTSAQDVYRLLVAPTLTYATNNLTRDIETAKEEARAKSYHYIVWLRYFTCAAVLFGVGLPLIYANRFPYPQYLGFLQSSIVLFLIVGFSYIHIYEKIVNKEQIYIYSSVLTKYALFLFQEQLGEERLPRFTGFRTVFNENERAAVHVWMDVQAANTAEPAGDIPLRPTDTDPISGTTFPNESFAFIIDECIQSPVTFDTLETIYNPANREVKNPFTNLPAQQFRKVRVVHHEDPAPFVAAYEAAMRTGTPAAASTPPSDTDVSDSDSSDSENEAAGGAAQPVEPAQAEPAQTQAPASAGAGVDISAIMSFINAETERRQAGRV